MERDASVLARSRRVMTAGGLGNWLCFLGPRFGPVPPASRRRPREPSRLSPNGRAALEPSAHPARRDPERPLALTELLEGGHLGRLDEIGDQRADAGSHGGRIRHRCRREAVVLRQAERQTGERVGWSNFGSTEPAMIIFGLGTRQIVAWSRDPRNFAFEPALRTTQQGSWLPVDQLL